MFWGAEKQAAHNPFPRLRPAQVPSPRESLRPRTGCFARPPAPTRPSRAPQSPSRSSARRAGGPGLTTDHPAAEGSVAAEQRGAQQQPDHAAHCGAAAAAGVLRGAKAVSGHRAAGALTPAPPCLPAGPTPAARAQPRGPLHASPLAGLLPRAGVLG